MLPKGKDVTKYKNNSNVTLKDTTPAIIELINDIVEQEGDSHVTRSVRSEGQLYL